MEEFKDDINLGENVVKVLPSYLLKPKNFVPNHKLPFLSSVYLKPHC